MADDVAAVILMGHGLSVKEAQVHEQKLSTNPDLLDERLQLIGYYFKHYYCCEAAGKRRIDHIVWLIRKRPNFNSMLMSYLHTHLLDRRAYACIKAAWSSAVSKNGADPDVLCNMAAFVQCTEPELAEQLLEKAMLIAPASANVNGRLSRLRQTMSLLIESRDSIASSSNSYFVPGAVVCPDRPKLTSGTLTSVPKNPNR